MPGAARQFEPQITRSGGAPSQYRFTTRCSGCSKTDTFEASRPVGDDRVRGYFRQRGWVLGRERADDLCPACLGKPAKQPGTSTRATAADEHHRNTAEILARHLGKPEVLAAEVFRPKAAQPPTPSVPDAPRPAVPAPALSAAVEQALIGMAADLKGLRTTIELMAEQMSLLVALGGQQIEAITRLGPLVIQSAEGLSGSLREVVGAVGDLSRPPASMAGQQPVSEGEPATEQAQDVSLERETDQALAVTAPTQQTSRSSARQSKGRRTAAPPVAVKSIPDAKRPDRFYTSIRLPRELWNRAGLGPQERIRIEWTRKTLSVHRALEGGVKPKTIGDAVVVLQSWKLGNLNFDQARVTSGEGFLRLMCS